MEYFKILIGESYKTSLVVCRPLVREMKKIGENNLIENNKVVILVYSYNNKYYELFTRKEINNYQLIPISRNEIDNIIESIEPDKLKNIKELINNIIFNEINSYSTNEEKIMDRGEIFREYINNYTSFNPYSKSNEGKDYKLKIKK